MGRSVHLWLVVLCVFSAAFARAESPSPGPCACSQPTTTTTIGNAVMAKRRADAISDLVNLRVAEVAFYAEYGTYLTNIHVIGFLPAKGERSHVVGFSRREPIPPQVAVSVPAAKLTESIVSTWYQFLHYYSLAKGSLDFFDEVDPEYGKPLGTKYGFWFSPERVLSPNLFAQEAMRFCGQNGCTATSQGFKAIAIGNLDNDCTEDVLTIDQDGNIRVLVDDIKQ